MCNLIKHCHLSTENGYLPKNHQLLHLAHRAMFQGNPKKYANFLNEALNSTLKKAARYCHQRTFEVCLLRRMRYLLLKNPKGNKRPLVFEQ